MRISSILAAAGVVALSPAWGQEAPPAAADAGVLLATVDGTQITLGHVVAATQGLPQQYKDLPDAALLNIVLEQLVDQAVLAASVSTDPAADPLAVRLQLENQRQQALAFRALNARMAGAVDDAKIEAEYDRRVADFQPTTEYSAAHILVATESEAADLRARIEGGADFAELARVSSTDAGSGAQGGALGWFGPGRMVPAFEAAVVTAAPGEIVGPVQTQFGWHLIRVDATRQTEIPPLGAVKAQIAEELGQAAIQAALAEMRTGAKIERPETSIDPALIRDATLLDQ